MRRGVRSGHEYRHSPEEVVMARLACRQGPARFPDLFDWLEPPWAARLPFTAGQTFRVEGYVQDGSYVVRA